MKGVFKLAAVIVVVLFVSGAGCQTVPEPTVVTKIVERKSEIPKSLLECMDEPKATEVWETQRDVGLYIEQLALAGQDCRTRQRR
jgi:hypothetical protein